MIVVMLENIQNQKACSAFAQVLRLLTSNPEMSIWFLG
jgi:hypothetical protein